MIQPSFAPIAAIIAHATATGAIINIPVVHQAKKPGGEEGKNIIGSVSNQTGSGTITKRRIRRRRAESHRATENARSAGATTTTAQIMGRTNPVTAHTSVAIDPRDMPSS